MRRQLGTATQARTKACALRLRGVAEDFRKQVGSGVVALIGLADGKAAVTVAVTADVTDRVNAADLARAAVLAMGWLLMRGRTPLQAP